MEVRYKLFRDFGSDRSSTYLDILFGWPMRIVESTPEWGQVAADVKVPGKISLGDAWVAALGLIEDATVVHKDPEFDAVSDLKVFRLPYKARGARS
jgi:predicted nucleic acid-binding protein